MSDIIWVRQVMEKGVGREKAKLENCNTFVKEQDNI